MSDNDRMLIIYEGPHVGVLPDVAGAVTAALVEESKKQGDRNRFHVLSITLARNAIAMKIRLYDRQLSNEEQYLTEARVIFRAVCDEAYKRARGYAF